MPLISSDYKSPFWLRNGHLATIIPSSFRKVEGVNYARERISTPDGDFLDLDWLRGSSSKLVIISHGLEGSSQRPYVKGMARHFNANGWDVLAWNCRSCSGEINQTKRFYHHGATDDLHEVVRNAIETDRYLHVAMVGFSMGGSLTLKYLGEQAGDLSPIIKAGVAFSIPVSLKSSVDRLSNARVKFYERRFLKKLETKIKTKSEKYPNLVSYNGFMHIHSFEDFDNHYTAPIHGFDNAHDFYEKASAGKYMEGTPVPTLICNALNDPFLGEECYPTDVCQNHSLLYLETPQHGGHVGFSLANSEINYMEKRALSFVEEVVGG